MNTMELLLIVALAAAFVVLLVKKWGIAEWMQIHAGEFFSKLFSCDLCMSFWACVIITAVVVVYERDLTLVLLPVVTTPVTRMLV